MPQIIPMLLNMFRRQDVKDQPKLLSAVGFIALLVYAFSRTASRDIGEDALAVVGFLGLWCLFKYGKRAHSAPLFLLVALSIVIQFIPWGLSHFTHPDWAEKNPLIDYLSRWFIFIPLAWWVAQYKHGIWLLYTTGAAAILLSPWISGNGTQEIINGLNGKRVDFDLQNAQHTSLFFSVIALGLMCFLARIYRFQRLLALLASLTIMLSFSAVLISASRQAWLALIFTFFAFSLVFITNIFKATHSNKKKQAVVFIITIAIALAYFLSNNNTVKTRIYSEHTTISKLVTLDFHDIPYSNIGIRLHSWIAATEFIKEKPILGWGSNGMTLVIKKTEWLPNSIKKQFGHLHNSYIEITVNYGVVGLIFYLLTWLYFSKTILRYVRANKLPKDIGYFYFSFLCFWSVMICFEAYQNYWTGTLCLHIILAGILGKIWHTKLHPPETL